MNTTTITPIYVAALAHANGCAGVEKDGHILFPTPTTREQVDSIWQHARQAATLAGNEWEQQQLCPKQPEFDAAWQGTRAEYTAALQQHRTVRDTWLSQRRTHVTAAEQAVWAAHGGELTQVRNGHLPSCGGEYDDEAHTDSGAALYVLRRSSCRCMCGWASYHDDADEEEGGSFFQLATPVMWQVTLDDTHPVALACGTHRFITASSDETAVQAAFNAALEAKAAAEQVAARRYEQLVERASVTSEQLDAMTFPEWEAWHERNGVAYRLFYAGSRDQIRHAEQELANWETTTLDDIHRAAGGAAAKAGCWPIGNPLPRKGLS